MTVDEIKNFVEYISNKEQSGESLSPLEFNRLLKTSAIDFTRFLYGAIESYKPGEASPPVSYEATQYITDALRAVKVLTPLTVDVTGSAPIPADYAHESSIRYTYNKPGRCDSDPLIPKTVSIEIVKDDKVGVRLGSTLSKPKANRPICVFYKNTIQFYPINIGSVAFTYLKTPATPVWGFTVSGDVPVYDATSSVQPEFPEIFHLDICRIILGYMGVNLRDNDLQSFNERFKQTGR